MTLIAIPIIYAIMALIGFIGFEVGISTMALTHPSFRVRGSYHATDTAFARSKGTACILQQGDHTNLVIYLYNLPATKGSETYQVWMLQDGRQSNAGTFRVGDDGLGVLVTEMRPEDRFDSIGVTLEPNASGTKPRRNAVISAPLSHSNS